MTNFVSPIAAQVPHRSDAIVRRSQIFGLLIHTTGGGVPEQARQTGRDPAAVALSVYAGMQGHTGGQGSAGYPWAGPGYLADWGGKLYQIAEDDVETYHAGGPDRADYLDGAWEARCGVETVAQWRRRWSPKYANPQQLYPSRTPNADYVGLELIPCAPETAMAPHLRFTKAQHDACVALARDLAGRHGWPAGWQLTSRLLGHEDVQPIERHDGGGGWDPGFLRAAPYFDFDYVRGTI